MSVVKNLTLPCILQIKDDTLWIDHFVGTSSKKMFWDPQSFRPSILIEDLPQNTKLRSTIRFQKENINQGKLEIVYPYQISVLTQTGIEKRFTNIR